MAKEHFVIIGNGPAGNQAAFTLREKAPEARITLITKNREGFYLPHLLPDYIAGKIPEVAVMASSLSHYREKGIKLRCGQKIVGLKADGRQVVFGHKELLPFDGLIIAVGGRPRIPEQLAVFQDLIFTLKTIEDAKNWIENLPQVNSILVLGGDLTSLAVTKALLHLEKKVYFMLNEDAFWPLRCNEKLFEEVSQKLLEKGVEVLKYRTLKGVAQISDRLCQVHVDHQRIRVGMIGAFYGLVPDIQFLARSGLEMDRGILVDEYLSTGIEGIYATGDCAQIYHPGINDYWVSIGHENAVALGRIAAQNLVGAKIRAKVPGDSILRDQSIRVNTSWWMNF